MKALSNYFLRKPVTGCMLLLLMIILGGISVLRLPVGLMPDTASPGITIITRQSGISAEKIEETLTVPIERNVSDIKGIESIISSSSEGESRINLIFSYDEDIKSRILDVSEKVNIIRSSFSRDVQEPFIVRYDPSDEPVFIASFSSRSLDLKSLREYIEKNIRIKFERIEGVSQVFVGGGYEREIQISMNSEKMSLQGMTPDHLSHSLNSQNIYIPAGKIDDGRHVRRIYLDAKIRYPEEFAKLPVILNDAKSASYISMDRIAEVRDHYRERGDISRTNGEDRVAVYVQKAGDSNTIEITDQCSDVLENLKGNTLIQIHTDYNQGKFIRNAIMRIVSASCEGGIITVFILYLFLRRLIPTFLVAISIPASVTTTFFFMYLFHISINIISLSGLALGVGMLIDNSIVVMESINKSGMLKASSYETVLHGVSSVITELLSSTLTTIIVFLPLIFTDPETGRMYRDLALTVSISLLISLFFSITILPSFYLAIITISRSANIMGKSGNQNCRKNSEYRRIDAFQELLKVLSADSVNRFLSNLTMKYLELSRFLQMRKKQAGSAILIFSIISVPPFIFIGREGSSGLSDDTISASVELKTGTTLEKTETVVSEIERELRKHTDISEVSSKIEKSHAEMHIKINSKKKSHKSLLEYSEEISRIGEIASEASFFINSASEGESTEELNIDFYGNNTQLLKKTATDACEQIQNRVKGIHQAVLRFKEPKSDILIHPDSVKVSASMSTNAELGSALRTLLSGGIITKFYDKNREVDVRLLSDRSLFDSTEGIKKSIIPVTARGIHLDSVSEVTEGTGETKLWRKNKRKTASITLKLKNRSIDRVADDIKILFLNYSFPEDVTYSLDGKYEKMMKSQRELAIAIIASILLIYFLLGALFESFRLPLLILATSPLTIFLMIDIYYVSGISLSISILIGFIMLSGMMNNTSILLVSTIDKRYREMISEWRFSQNSNKSSSNMKIRSGKFCHPYHEIYKTASERIRPVLMTTASTVFGMFPMIWDFSEGGEMWRNLAMTVSLGLIVSTFLNLALLPFFYYWLIVKKIPTGNISANLDCDKF